MRVRCVEGCHKRTRPGQERGIRYHPGDTTDWLLPGPLPRFFVRISRDDDEQGPPTQELEKPRPLSNESRGLRIANACAQLDHDDDTSWTQDGQPAVNAVSQIVGDVVTRDELKVHAADVRRGTRA